MFEGRNTSLARIGYLETEVNLAKSTSKLKETDEKVFKALIFS